MKIGFDAKWYFDGPPSGRRVVRGMIGGLARLAQDDEVHLFLDARRESEWESIDIPRAQQHYVWAGNNQLSNLWNVPRAADDAGMDVVAYQNFVPPRLRARHARIAFVHDVIFDEHPHFFTTAERLYFSTVRPLARSADRVCTVSASEKARIARRGFAAEAQIDVVPHGIDDRFQSKPGSSDADELTKLGVQCPYVLYVGRLTRRKNVSTLVRAMAHVSLKPLSLVIVGASDATDASLPALARELGLADRIRFLGPIYDDRLATLYRNASAFCFPTWDESYGLPPLEAMACGTPCVVSDLPVLREMYGDAALFADPNDETSFARAIDELVQRSDDCAALRERGQTRAASFTWQRAAELLLASARAAVESRRT